MATTTSPLAAMLSGQLGGIADSIQPAPPDLHTAVQAPQDLFHLHDKRKVFRATGVPMVSKYSKAGAYDQNFMKEIVKAANHVGVDPNLALAVGLQEGNFKKHDINYSLFQSPATEATPEGLDEDAYRLTKLLKDKMQEGKQMGFRDEARQIQMFNGMGKLGPETPTSYYGIKVSKESPLNMRHNPVYGRVIQDLRDNVIKANPDLQKFIATVK